MRHKDQTAFVFESLTQTGLVLQIITPFTIYFNARFVYQKWELWRLLTNFMFFGSLGGSLTSLCALLDAVSVLITQLMTELKAPIGGTSHTSWQHVMLPWQTHGVPMPRPVHGAGTEYAS